MKIVKGIMLLADSFEDIEGLGTLDLLRRARITVDTVSITGKREITTQSNVVMLADKLIENVNLDEYEFLIIPGGAAVMKTHLHNKLTEQVVSIFVEKGLLVATICAAPSIVGKAGYLKDCNYTCFPSFEKLVEEGTYLPNEKVVVYNNFITSKACGTTFEFAYEIIKYLKSEAIAKHIIDSVFYE